MYFISISKCGSPVKFAALSILSLYLARIDNLPIHLGYHSTNNDWRVSLQLFIVITKSMNTKSWIFGLTESADFGVSEHFRFKHLLIFPGTQVKKRISHNPPLPTSPDQWLKMVLTYEISRDAGQQYSNVRWFFASLLSTDHSVCIVNYYRLLWTNTSYTNLHIS